MRSLSCSPLFLLSFSLSLALDLLFFFVVLSSSFVHRFRRFASVFPLLLAESTASQSVFFSRTHSHERTARVHRGRMRKGSRMDSATWSRCNCMLIECASEYGIRMEAIQFDVPFCLRLSFPRARHPPLPHHLVVSSASPSIRRRSLRSPLSFFVSLRSSSPSSLLLWLQRRHCMKFENDSPLSVHSSLSLSLFISRRLSVRSFSLLLPFPLARIFGPCLAFVYRRARCTSLP